MLDRAASYSWKFVQSESGLRKAIGKHGTGKEGSRRGNIANTWLLFASERTSELLIQRS